MTEDETGLALAEALKTDLVFRLDLLHQAGASKLILATVLMDLALQLTEAEQGAAAEEMVRSSSRPTSSDRRLICSELRRRKTLAPSSIQSSWSIADVLAAVEDLLLAQATYEAARQRWPLANAL
jgi:hypothetical protein